MKNIKKKKVTNMCVMNWFFYNRAADDIEGNLLYSQVSSKNSV